MRHNPLTEARFDIRMRASRIQGGQAKYEQLCGHPQFYIDPLDAIETKKKQRGVKDMTPEEFRFARGQLGHLWGLGRPLTLTELGRVLRLGGVRPDQSVRDYERGKTQVSGPLSVLVEMMLDGAKPKDLDQLLSRGKSSLDTIPY